MRNFARQHAKTHKYRPRLSPNRPASTPPPKPLPFQVLLCLPDGVHALPSVRSKMRRQKTDRYSGVFNTFADRGEGLQTTGDEVLQGLGRILKLQEEQREVDAEVERVCGELAGAIKARNRGYNRAHELAARRARVAELRRLCDREGAALKAERERVRKLRKEALPRAALLSSLFSQLSMHREQITALRERMENVDVANVKVG